MSEQASQSLAIRGILAWRRTCLDYVWGEERQKDKQRLFWPIMTTNQCVACWRCDRIKAEVWYHWCVLEPTYPSQICMVIGGVLIWAKWAQFFCADIKICFSKTNKRKKKKTGTVHRVGAESVTVSFPLFPHVTPVADRPISSHSQFVVGTFLLCCYLIFVVTYYLQKWCWISL